MAKHKTARPEPPRAEWVPNYHQRKYAAERAAEKAPEKPGAEPVEMPEAADATGVQPATRKGRTPKAEASAEAVNDTTPSTGA